MDCLDRGTDDAAQPDDCVKDGVMRLRRVLAATTCLCIVAALTVVVFRVVTVRGALQEADKRAREATTLITAISTTRDVQDLDRLMKLMIAPGKPTAPMLSSVGHVGIHLWDFREPLDARWAGKEGRSFFISWCTRVYVLVRLGTAMPDVLRPIPIGKSDLSDMVSVVHARTLEHYVGSVGVLNAALVALLALSLIAALPLLRGNTRGSCRVHRAGPVPEE